ncbi:MAG: hypothetical protein IJ123_01770 [Blautia sp.]|nr:hypothetical protein [Blautia sp.]
MSEFKIKSMREKFEEDYKAVKVPCGNKKGYKIDYVYIGDWWLWKEPRDQVNRCKRYVMSCCIGSLVLYLAAALQNSPVNYSRFVSMTGLLSLAPYIFVIFGSVQFLVSKEKMTEQDCKDIRTKLMVAPVFHAGLLLICAVLCTLEVVRNQYELPQLLIGLCFLLSGLQSLLIVIQFRKLHEYKVPNDTK